MAGWLITKLGYGKFALIDPDNPSSPPAVTAAITAPTYDTFTRIVQGQFNNNEEVRREYIPPFEYVAVASSGSSTTALVWACVRCEWSNNHRIRLQFRDNLAWDSRAIGW